STLGNYWSTLLAFWQFCDSEGVLDTLHLPAPEHLLCAFVASFTGTHVHWSICNMLSGVRTWYIVQGTPSPTSSGARLGYVLNSVKHIAPNSKPPCPPVTMQMLELLCLHLDHHVPKDACVLAAADTTFWTQSRLDELFPSSSTTFNPRRTPLRRHLGHLSGTNGARLLHYLYTKTKCFAGNITTMSRQHGVTDHLSSLGNHLAVNSVQADIPPLLNEAPFGHHCFTKKRFLAVCNHIWQAHGVPSTTGHYFHIGSTTELLAHGVDPTVVKVMGWWSSDAFLCYWRDLEEVVLLHAELLHPCLIVSPALAKVIQKKRSRPHRALPSPTSAKARFACSALRGATREAARCKRQSCQAFAPQAFAC
ncbi:hypothetical protein OH77DRAFT_1405507, partial [Trametes cingulata]